jgi:hypothetical protein
VSKITARMSQTRPARRRITPMVAMEMPPMARHGWHVVARGGHTVTLEVAAWRVASASS